jgi:phosphoribosyl-ATP pyrophosphohydrolase
MSAARSQNITDVDPRAVTIARQVIDGKNDRQIADSLGLSREHVNRLKHKPATQALLQQFLEENREELAAAGKKVVKSISDDIDDPLWMGRSAARQQYINILALANKLPQNDSPVDTERQKQVRTLRHTIKTMCADGTSIEEVWEYIERRTKEVIGEDVSGLKDEVLAGLEKD